MAVPLYMDVHVPMAITVQLRRRKVDVLTAQDDGATELADADLLKRAGHLQRLTFTQDIRFRVLAENWIRSNKPFNGLIYGHQLRGTIGQFVQDLELIAKASEPDEWLNVVQEIPFS